MFIRKRDYNELVDRVQTLESYTHRDYERLKSHDNHLKDLQKTIGSQESSTGLSMIMERWYGVSPEPKLSITKQIEGIMHHVGLRVRSTPQKTEVVKIPATAPKKIVTKKGK